MIGILVTGIDKWELTKAAIESIREWVSDETKLVVLDNGDKKYPSGVGYEVIVTNKRVCYSAAINMGFARLLGMGCDWLLSVNNDVILNGPIDHIEDLDRRVLYGRQICREKGITWFGNWLFLVHRDTWKEVGEFDTKFKMCGFEDADYAMRAYDMGIPTMWVDLPFTHLWGETRWQLPKYKEVRISNMDYLESKWGIRLGEDVKVVKG